MNRITYVVMGSIENPPLNGVVSVYPLCEPEAATLYQKRIEYMRAATTDYVCLLDGGTDVLLPNFEQNVNQRIRLMDAKRVDVSYADEISTGGRCTPAGMFTLHRLTQRLTMMHHGVICRTQAIRDMTFPEGEYLFEAMCYGTLAQSGYVYTPGAVYNWIPSERGARMWLSTGRAESNTYRWFTTENQGKVVDDTRREALRLKHTKQQTNKKTA